MIGSHARAAVDISSGGGHISARGLSAQQPRPPSPPSSHASADAAKHLHILARGLLCLLQAIHPWQVIPWAARPHLQNLARKFGPPYRDAAANGPEDTARTTKTTSV